MKTFFTYILIFLSLTSISQTNLVSNGSFEQIVSCPTTTGVIGYDVVALANGWRTPTYGTSDLFNINCSFASVTPPQTGLGYQYPRTGDGMAGFFVYWSNYEEYREYVQCEFSNALNSGSVYKVSFWVNTNSIINQASSSVGAFLTTYQFSNNSSKAISVIPQINNDDNNIILDTLGWTEITGLYIAKGGEKYLTIGNFRDSLEVILMNPNPADSLDDGVYFFIDDVEVIKMNYSVFIPNVFSPNGDNINDLFCPNIKNIGEWKCFIYNRWGQEIYKLTNGLKSWDGRTNAGKEAPEGTYYYVFSATIENEEISEKGFISLLR